MLARWRPRSHRTPQGDLHYARMRDFHRRLRQENPYRIERTMERVQITRSRYAYRPRYRRVYL